MELKQKIDIVEQVICAAANITKEELYSNSRKREIVDARAAVWFVLNKRLACPLAYIGELYGRDHTTVLHAVRRVQGSKIGEVALKVVAKHAAQVLRKKQDSGPLSVDGWVY